MSAAPQTDALTPPRLTTGARRILETAGELFYAHGIHAVGVDTIAAESGITKRTLYNRFESKDGLVVAYLQFRHDAWWQRLESRLEHLGDGKEASERVMAVFDSYTLDSQSADRGCGFINAAAELPDAHPGRAVIRAHKQRVVELISGCMEDSGIPDPFELAEHIFLILEGAMVHFGIDGDDRRLRRARELVSRLLA